MKKTSEHKTHIQTFFWQSRNKSDKKHNLWFDLYLVFFFPPSLNIVPLIGSDCPSQSRDAILVAIETSSASAGQCTDNVAATFLRGCHSNTGMNTSRRQEELYLKYLGDCRGPGFRLDWTFFCLFHNCFYLMRWSVNSQVLWYVSFWCQINIYIFIGIQAIIDKE